MVTSFSFLIVGSCGLKVKVPHKQETMINLDGKIGSEEWQDTNSVQINSMMDLLLLQNNSDFYLAIEVSEDVARYVDIFIKPSGHDITNLHASMQLGERLLTGEWNDTIPQWNWGNNDNWSANTVILRNHNDTIPFIQLVQPYNGFEFRIARDKIEPQFKIRIEIKDFEGKAEDVVYPKHSKRDDLGSWKEIDLNN